MLISQLIYFFGHWVLIATMAQALLTLMHQNEDHCDQSEYKTPKKRDLSYHINFEEGCRVVRGSVAANQDPESVRVNLFGEKKLISSKKVTPLKVKLNFRKKKGNLCLKKVTPLKLNISKRKYDKSLLTDEEDTEPGLEISETNRKAQRKIVKPKNTAVESILPMKVFMKPGMRIERSKEAKSFLPKSKNIDVTEKEIKMNQFTLEDEENQGDTEDATWKDVQEIIKVDNVFEDKIWEDIQNDIQDDIQDNIQDDKEDEIHEDIQDEVHESKQYEVVMRKNMGLWRNGGG